MKRTPIYPPTNAGPPAGLTRYGSAPGSLLTSIADSILDGDDSDSDFGSGSRSEAPRHLPSRFLSSSSSASSAVAVAAGDSSPCLTSESSCCKDACGDANSKQLLARQSSSPAGFFSNLLLDNGLSVNKGNGHYSQPLSNGVHAMPRTRRLKSQLSFSGQEPLSQISEIGVTDMGESVIGGNRSDETGGNVGQSYISTNFQISSWDDTNSIAFSAPSSKRARDCNEDLLNSFSNIGFEFGLTSLLDMEAQQDSVAFKVRAKRGCATHPRSIAERERRTRISDKLRKLQELVPNMDKQTSTSDMLDLAVEQIKKLQSQVQNLKQEQADCTCACKEEIP